MIYSDDAAPVAGYTNPKGSVFGKHRKAYELRLPPLFYRSKERGADRTGRVSCTSSSLHWQSDVLIISFPNATRSIEI